MTYIALYTSFQWILEEILEGQPERNHGLMYVYFFSNLRAFARKQRFFSEGKPLGVAGFCFLVGFPFG